MSFHQNVKLNTAHGKELRFIKLTVVESEQGVPVRGIQTGFESLLTYTDMRKSWWCVDSADFHHYGDVLIPQVSVKFAHTDTLPFFFLEPFKLSEREQI